MDRTPRNSRYLRFMHWNEGTKHWFFQRILSALMIPLSLLFVIPFVSHYDFDYEHLIEIYKSPIWSGAAWVVLTVTLMHFRLGMQEVIEDYVHSKKQKKILLTLNNAFFSLVVLSLLMSVIKIVY
tara:strand:+ start:278 stop:652 length:375 start_codon:yes stop_codon:yes gene_type:complete